MSKENTTGKRFGISESNMATATAFSVFLMIPWMVAISWVCVTIGIKKYDGYAIFGTLFIALPLTFSLLIWLHKKYIDDPEELAKEIVETKDTVNTPTHSNLESTNNSFFDMHAKKTFIIGIVIWTTITMMTNIDENITAFILRSLGPQTDSIIGSMAKMAAFFSGHVAILFVLASGWYGYLNLRNNFTKNIFGN